jgi:hypothetical protein
VGAEVRERREEGEKGGNVLGIDRRCNLEAGGGSRYKLYAQRKDSIEERRKGKTNRYEKVRLHKPRISKYGTSGTLPPVECRSRRVGSAGRSM